MKKIIMILMFVFLIFQCGCEKSNNANTQKIEQEQLGLDIMVTNKCLYNMVKDICGGNNNIDFMFKDEDKIENFVFTSDSITNMGKQDLLIYSGAGFEAWIDDFLGKIDKSKVNTINVSRGISLMNYSNKNLSSAGNKNPYYWMDPDNYRIMLLNVKNAIEEKDPKNRSKYETNFNNSIKKIDDYKKGMNELNKTLKDYTFVVDTDKLDYLLKNVDAKDIKFYRSNQGAISPDDESKISEEKGNNKKLFFIYNDDLDLQQNNDIITKYNMKPIKLTVYNGDMSYLELLKNNETAIKNFTQNTK